MRIKAALYDMDFFDIHYHANPDMYLRSYNAIEVGKILSTCNGAVILKSHLGSTVEIAALAQELGYPIFGSLVLNKIAGGIDYHVVLAALAKYPIAEYVPLLVYFPTHTTSTHCSKLQRKLSYAAFEGHPLSHDSVSENGRLKSEVIEVMRLAKDYPIRLATGHATGLEVQLLAEQSAQLDLQNLLITHPTHPCCGLTVQNLVALSKSFSNLWFEQTTLTYLLGYQTYEDLQFIVRNIPRVIYSSDLGQPEQPAIPEWLKKSTQWFNSFNLAIDHQKQLFLDNAISFFS